MEHLRRWLCFALSPGSRRTTPTRSPMAHLRRWVRFAFSRARLHRAARAVVVMGAIRIRVACWLWLTLAWVHSPSRESVPQLELYLTTTKLSTGLDRDFRSLPDFD